VCRYTGTPGLRYASESTGARYPSGMVMQCMGRQSLIRFCNRAPGLPEERLFSVHLHGAASTAAYGEPHSIHKWSYFRQRTDFISPPDRVIRHIRYRGATQGDINEHHTEKAYMCIPWLYPITNSR
jgi:hypothetical protein